MKKETVLVFVVVFGLVWLSLTYLLFLNHNSPLSNKPQRHGLTATKLNSRIEGFESKLQSQIRENKALFDEVKALLRSNPGSGVKVKEEEDGKRKVDGFNDAADEYANRAPGDDFKVECVNEIGAVSVFLVLVLLILAILLQVSNLSDIFNRSFPKI